VFRRSDGVWSQLGSKLVGSDAIGQALEGTSVSLSGDGNTAIVGGFHDNGGVGAAWVFAQPVFAGTPGKANCFGKSVSALARQFGGLNNAAAALGFPSVRALQEAILDFCELPACNREDDEGERHSRNKECRDTRGDAHH
jgi:hypothetical protein